jgi:hypothetical protein
LELVHDDLCGSIFLVALGSSKYFLLIMGDHIMYMWVEFIRVKYEALSFIRLIKAHIKNDNGMCVGAL